MRIVQVCPYDLARPGGVQRHVLDLSRALAADGHQVTVFAPRSAGEPVAARGQSFTIEPLGGFRVVHVLGTGFELSMAKMAQVRAALDKAQPDIVHFHTIWTPVMSWQVWRALDAWPRTARVATFHDTPPDGWSGDLMRRVFSLASARISRKLQAAIPVSESPAAHLVLAPGCERHVLPACIDLSPYASTRPLAADVPPVVLFLGRLEPRKGALALIEAWARVEQRHRGARLIVLGDGPLRGQALSLVAELGLAESVRFEGAIDEVDKAQWFGRATLFCAPSLYGESYGLVLAEAMAAGLPVIAAANAGYRHVLVGAGALGLVAPGDVAELAARLSQWLGDAQLREQQSQWGRRACAMADINHQLPTFESIYADALRSKLEGSGK